MKIVFYPSKEAILASLGHNLKTVQADLDTSRKALASAEEKKNASSNLYLPDQDRALQKLKSEVSLNEATEASIQDIIGFIESGGETIQAEAEI